MEWIPTFLFTEAEAEAHRSGPGQKADGEQLERDLGRPSARHHH